jgi:hypothetical protein
MNWRPAAKEPVLLTFELHSTQIRIVRLFEGICKTPNIHDISAVSDHVPHKRVGKVLTHLAHTDDEAFGQSPV